MVELGNRNALVDRRADVVLGSNYSSRGKVWFARDFVIRVAKKTCKVHRS